MKALKEILTALKEKEITPEQAREYLQAISGKDDQQTQPGERQPGLVINSVQKIDELNLEPWITSMPGRYEIAVKVMASAINFPDIMCVKGLYPTMPPYPFVPGFEVAGIITAVGANVSHFKRGDQIIAVTGEGMGGHAGQVNVPESSATIKPDNITFEEACSLPVAFSTVFSAFQTARLQREESVLIQTATGGCGLMAMQLAHLLDCRIYATSSKPQKLDFLKRIGAHEVINYLNQPFDRTVLEKTNHQGVDVVLNMLSGDGIQKGLNCLASQGRYLEIAVHALKVSPKLDLSHLTDNQSFYSIDLRKKGLRDGFEGRAIFNTMTDLLKSELIVPIVSRTYPLHQIKEALTYVEKAQHIGKVVISHTAGEMTDHSSQLEARLRQQKIQSDKSLNLFSGNTPKSRPQKTKNQPIAIVGMAGNFPASPDLNAYWDNLYHGRNCVDEIPASRWDINRYYDRNKEKPGKSYSKWAGLLENANEFDPLFFNISPAEAESMDPQQRKLLESCWHCIEDAGIDSRLLSNTNCGVFVGCAANDYAEQSNQKNHTAQDLMGETMSILSARISYLLNLKGPCLAIDTACSSSLVALSEACNSLILGTCDAALAGGVSISPGPSLHVKTSKAGMLSEDGQCHTFDNGANGFVPGEGVGVLLLKRYDDAVESGDTIHGIIKGWGVNQDGKTNGITAPSAKSQTALQTKIYSQFDINPEHISLVEAHGTGTKLGDPIEIEALTTSFRQYTSQEQYCALGSVKANIGHALTAAGIAGIIKVLLSFKHQTLPPLANFKRLNEHIILENSPFYIPKEATPWEVAEGQKRMACVSSFGFSGTNAHIVLEEHGHPQPTKHQEPATVLIPLSAREGDQLRTMAQNLLEYLQQHTNTDLFALAYTLQTGRTPFEHRVAFVANSYEQCIDLLKDITGNKQNTDICTGTVPEHSDIRIAKEPDHTDLSKTALLWVKGTEIAWPSLYSSNKPQRLQLPGYPFAREKFWRNHQQPSDNLSHAQLHPLLHKNTSDLTQVKFETTLEGSELFLSDHVVYGQKTLPGVTYLEMAIAAIRQVRMLDQNTQIILKNVLWIAPVIVHNEPIRLTTTLALVNDITTRFEIYSHYGKEDVTLHSQGLITTAIREHPAPIDIDRIKNSCDQQSWSGKKCYGIFEKLGIDYGPAHQSIQLLNIGEEQVLAKLSLPAENSQLKEKEPYVLHPAIMDGALQSAIGLMGDTTDTKIALPFELEELKLLAPIDDSMHAYLRYSRETGRDSKVQKLDIDLYNASGELAVSLSGFASRLRVEDQNKDDQSANTALHVPKWIQIDGPQKAIKADYHMLIAIDPPAMLEKSLKADEEMEYVSITSQGENMAIKYRHVARELFRLLHQRLTTQSNQSGMIRVFTDNSNYSGLSGMLKSLTKEVPRCQTQLIVTESWNQINLAYDQLIHLRGADIKLDESGRYEKQWQEITLGQKIAKPWKDQGTYLITGGMGGLGWLFACEIATSVDTPRIILVGRSDLDQSKTSKITRLQDLGARIIYRKTDVADPIQVKELLQFIADEGISLNGILHSAGTLADNYLIRKDVAQIDEVLSPKVDGLYLLDEATVNTPLDLFVAFSSLAGAMGNAGQTDYACANAYMDQFMFNRHQKVGSGHRHGKSLSVNWPLWKDGGMSPDDETLAIVTQQTGIIPMTTDQGMRAFYQAYELDQPQVMIVHGLLNKIKPMLNPDSASKIIDQPLLTEGQPDSEQVINYLKHQIAKVIKLNPDRINAEKEMEHYGIDSVMTIQLTNQLEKDFGALPKTLFFEYQTIKALSTYFITHHTHELAKILGVDTNESKPAVQVIKKQSSPVNNKPVLAYQNPQKTQLNDTATPLDIAIIGMAGKYPDANDLDDFWHNLTNGKDSIREIPENRWDHSKYYSEKKDVPGKTYAKWGGFLDGIDLFDPLFFNISPIDAELMDPQERLFLESVWQTIEDAGYKKSALSVCPSTGADLQTGVFVGVMYSEYQFLGIEEQVVGTPIALYGNPASIANRTSYTFNFKGPSMTVDTMCSSSLTCIHLACQSILRGECHQAIAGGVNVSVHPNKYLLLGQGRFASSNGRCESFGKGGDGYVPGEGVGTVLLKPLTNAINDNDHIYGVIKGSAINHGGKTNGYTIPNPQAQSSAIERAIRESGVAPEAISYIEAHGTGTSLGDPIEIAGLGSAFKNISTKQTSCAIGSVKSNIGHLESAAGIAGLTKVLLQMKYKQLVPSIHSTTLNPNIDFDQTPFSVQQSLTDWQPNVIENNSVSTSPKRIAGISSFGAGGSNAHLVIEDYSNGQSTIHDVRRPVMILLTGKTPVALKQQVLQLIDYIESKTLSEHDLLRIAYTLQTGREHWPHRLAILVNDLQELEQCLSGFIKEEYSEQRYTGIVTEQDNAMDLLMDDEDISEAVNSWMVKQKWGKLLSMWVKGLDINWHKLYQTGTPQKIGLPTYPFEKKRYWFERTKNIKKEPVASNGEVKTMDLERILDDLLDEGISVTEAADRIKRTS